MIRFGLTVLVFLMTAGMGWAQQALAPARVTFRMGIGYDQGDFGTGETSRAAYLPVSVRFAANRFDLTVSSAFARIDTSGGIRLIDGVPTQIGTGVPMQEAGIGDTVVRSRFFVLDNSEGLPSVTPFVRVKIPTAREEVGLGTGKTDVGVGIEVDKRWIKSFFSGTSATRSSAKFPDWICETARLQGSASERIYRHRRRSAGCWTGEAPLSTEIPIRPSSQES
jgi:hypothetical protein